MASTGLPTILLTMILVSILTAIGYWVAISPYQDIMRGYQEILREKDDSYWEFVNRRETLNSEEQCQRQIGHFTTLVSACEDQLNSLLRTNVKRIQMREESHREVLSIFQSRAETKNEGMNANIIHCIQYWQQLQKELRICNSSQNSLRMKYREFKEREKTREQHILLTQEQLTQCQLKDSTNYSYLIVLAILAILTTLTTFYAMAAMSRSKKSLETTIQNPLPTSNSQADLLSERQAEVEQQREVEKEQLKSETKLLSERLAEVEKQREVEKEQLKELAQVKTDLAAAVSKPKVMLEDKEKLEKSLTESEKQIKRLTEERENAIKFGKQLVMEKKKLNEQCQEILARFETQESDKSKLMNEIQKLKIEIQTCHEHVMKTDKKLAAQKQENEDLNKHIKVLETKINRQGKSIQKRDKQNETLRDEVTAQETRIAKLNEKNLEREKELMQKDEEITHIKSALTKAKQALEKTEQEMLELQEKHAMSKRDNAEYEAALLQKEFELKKEVEKRKRVHKIHSHKEDHIKRLERQLQEMSHPTSKASKHKQLRPEINFEQIERKLQQEFEEHYNQLEIKTHNEIATLTETVGQLRIDLQEQTFELNKAKRVNKRLQELLDHSHARTRREKAFEANDRTYRLKVDFALTPPLPS